MQGATRGRRSFALAVVIGLIGLTGPASASAATVLGEAFSDSGGVTCPERTQVQTASPGAIPYAAPTDGVITSWTAGDHISMVKFKVVRLGGGDNFTVIGEDGPRPTGVTYPVRIPVRQGDTLGYSQAAGLTCPNFGGPEYAYRFATGDAPLGPAMFMPGSETRRLNISATLEPDADGDGFGDETQDGCPTDATVQGACPPPPDTTPPDTTFNDKPDAKTKKKQATFEFTSSEPGSTFECSLNGAPFASCSSPQGVKGKKGKNHFEVRAKDAAGNVDATPATFDWTVKKKKKK